MRIIITIIFTLTILCVSNSGFAQAEYPFGTIMKRVYDDEVIKATSNDTKIAGYIKTIDAKGSWADIDYNSVEITNWQPSDHFIRLKSIISGYVFDKSRYYQSEAAYKVIVKALNFWAENDFKSSNWWHNDIATPKDIGVALILMKFGKQKVDHDLEDLLVFKMISGDPYTKTGANKSDIAMHYFYRALITQDKNLLSSSLEQLFYPVKIVDGLEGLQTDFSYLQHGPQLYIAGYGEEFLKGISKIMAYVRETPYAMDPQKLSIFTQFVTDTYLPIIRSSYIDFNVHGRGVSRPNILNKKGESAILKQLLLVDPAKKDVWLKGISKLDSLLPVHKTTTALHKHFWKGDYTIHLKENYHFNVRIASSRTNKSEAGNKENIYGKNMTDGVTNIQVNGPEYYNIFPVWEWDKIPGTTTRDFVTDQVLVEQWGVPAKNKYAGGVSAEGYGVTAMKVDYDSVKANKSWFFYDNAIVCLGAGIESESEENIVTTINQTWLQGKLGGKNSLTSTDSSSFLAIAGDYITHNKVIYYFPSSAQTTLTTKKQSGTWYKINNARSKNIVQGDVFKLWLNHGSKPKNASYEYIVYPGQLTLNKNQIESIRIHSNSSSMQAVENSSEGIISVVFYEAGVFDGAGVKFTVDKPAIIQLLKQKEQVNFSVADPLYEADNINITLEVKDLNIRTNQNVQMPKDAFRGSTKNIVFKKQL